jgi:16S rRNA A1518/A1519 N6-dimethyltransferase RsmA/KsgA/DIM1 with predicted DNA glycosylase/AP lyase activity
MNLFHRWLCNSANWRKVVETYIVPWTLEDVDLGSDLLEVGPGPGISTDLLHRRVSQLTCVEIDRSYAEKLSRRSPGNVHVVCEDATKMSLADPRGRDEALRVSLPGEKRNDACTQITSLPGIIKTGSRCFGRRGCPLTLSLES